MTAADPSAFEIGVLVSEVVVVVLGLFISYVAYRGYRDHGSRPMLFVALGFVLLAGVPAAAAIGFFLVPGFGEVPTVVVTQGASIGGMLSIIYGLRADPE